MLGSDEESQVIEALYLAASPTQVGAAFGVARRRATVREAMMLKTRIIHFLQNAPEGATIQEVIDTLLDDDKIKSAKESE